MLRANKKFLLVASLMLLLLGVAALRKQHRVYEVVSQSEFACKDDECFALVGISTRAEASNYLQQTLTEWGALALAGQHISMSCVAVHYTAGSLQRLELPGPDFVQLAVFKGRLVIATLKGAEGWDVRAWDGHKFEQVSVPDPTALKFFADDEQGVKAVEGWKFAAAPESGARSIALSHGSFTLRADRAADEERVSVVVEAPGISPQVLWSGQEGWRSITRSEFASRIQKMRQIPGSAVLNRDQLLLLAVKGLLVVFGLVMFVYSLYASSVKSTLLVVTLPNKEFPPTTPDRHPGIDVGTIDQLTQQLTAMGFAVEKDFAFTPPPVNFDNFARLFTSRQHGCYAEVFQLVEKGKGLPVACSFHTFFSDGWSFSSSTCEPQPVTALLRLPKVTVRLEPGLDLAELLRRHLEQRQQIGEDLGITPESERSFERYVANQRQSMSERHQRIKGMRMWQILGEYRRALRQPVYAWWGDYPKTAAERRKQKAAATSSS